jgi:hypothetical protein
MDKFYATLDSEDGSIQEDAHIVKFDTRAEAEAYLRDGYDPAEWAVDIKDGGYSDCWMKFQNAPRVGDAALAPFSYTQLSILRPGQHPGGKQYWITPRSEVLVAMPRWIGE